MIVGMDLDGCNQLFGPHFWSGLPKLGIPNQHLPQDFAPYDFYVKWGYDREWFIDTCHRLVDTGHLFRLMEPIAGSVEAWQRIVDAGHTIEVITAREFGSPGAAEAATRHMLETAGYPFHGLTVSADKTVIRTDAFVEDHLGNYDALEAVGTKAIMVNQPWNHVPDDDRLRVNSVTEAADMILAMG